MSSKKVVPAKKPSKKGTMFITVLENVTNKNGKIKKTLTNYTNKDGSDVSYAKIKDTYNTYLKAGIKAENIYIQAMGPSFVTIKSLEEEDLKDWESEEYYENRVRYTEEFTNSFKFFRICIVD